MQIPTEHVEQAHLFQWATLQSAKYPELELLYAIPNVSYGGGTKNMLRGKKLKMEGRKKGVPDIFLPVAKNGFHGLYIEMKRQKGGSVSTEQKWWIERLSEQGYRCEVCKGFEVAKNIILEYLK